MVSRICAFTKMPTKVLAAFAGLGLLAGCAGGLPLGPDVMVGGQNFAAARGEADLVVRTHVIGADGSEREVGGAVCDVTSVLYSARLTTPARLRLPNFGAQSPELMLDCAAGELRGSASRPITTVWRTAPGYPGVGGWYGGGWYGPGWYGPGWYGPGWGPWDYPEPRYPVSLYPDVSVQLR